MTDEEQQRRDEYRKQRAAILLVAELNKKGAATTPPELTIDGARDAIERLKEAFPQLDPMLKEVGTIATKQAAREAIVQKISDPTRAALAREIAEAQKRLAGLKGEFSRSANWLHPDFLLEKVADLLRAAAGGT